MPLILGGRFNRFRFQRYGGLKNIVAITYIEVETAADLRQTLPPCNNLDTGALRLPTLDRQQPITCLMPSLGRQPQRTDVQLVAGGDVLSVYDRTNNFLIQKDKQK